jgi:hypothetical protein
LEDYAVPGSLISVHAPLGTLRVNLHILWSASQPVLRE